MIRLSEEAKRLTSTFFSYRNDIDIYTEDEDKDREFYRVLFERLLKGSVKINDITPLGSKDAVKNRCAKEPKNGRKKIFIIDGDVTIIHGGISIMRNLFVLDAYCIENLLFEEEALIQFIYLNCAVKSKEIIKEEVNFNNWMEEYCALFIELFTLFGVADYFGKRYTLFNAKKYHVLNEDKYVFDPRIILDDIEDIKNEILKEVDFEKFTKVYSELKGKWTNTTSNLFKIVSGKDYLIPILLIKTRDFKKSKALPSLEEVKMQLVQYCSLDRLLPLKNAIEKA